MSDANSASLQWILMIDETITPLLLPFHGKSREQAKNQQKTNRKKKQQAIKALKKKQDELMDSLTKTQNLKLYERLQEERATLDAKIEIMTKDLEGKKYAEINRKALLQKVQHLFEDPLAIRQLGNQNMRGLLVTVRFGDNLFYTKKEGLQTVESGTL